jgi:hypothetical protein
LRAFHQQGRQDSNLQPPVLKSEAGGPVDWVNLIGLQLQSVEHTFKGLQVGVRRLGKQPRGGGVHGAATVVP